MLSFPSIDTPDAKSQSTLIRRNSDLGWRHNFLKQNTRSPSSQRKGSIKEENSRFIHAAENTGDENNANPGQGKTILSRDVGSASSHEGRLAADMLKEAAAPGEDYFSHDKISERMSIYAQKGGVSVDFAQRYAEYVRSKPTT